MANVRFTNFASSLLAVGVNSSATTLAVTGGQGARFPVLTAGQYFYVTLEDASLNREIVKVTARATDSFTVVRGQDGTTARAWLAGDSVALRFNAAAIDDLFASAVDTTSAQSVGGVKTFTDVTNLLAERETRVLGGTGGAYAVNLATGNYFSRTFNASGAVTVTNVPASGIAQAFIFDITNAGAFTITWPTNTRWAGGTAPALTASGRDVLGFFTYDGGANWNGLLLAKDIK